MWRKKLQDETMSLSFSVRGPLSNTREIAVPLDMPAAPVAAMADPLRGAVQIVKDRLYYVPLKSAPARNATATITNPSTGQPESRPIHYFSIDNEFVYWNFFLDFGPLNLGHLYRFSKKLNEKLEDARLADKVICYYSSAAPTKRTNAAYLICAWQVLYMNRSPDEAFAGFQGGHLTSMDPTRANNSTCSAPPRNVAEGDEDLMSLQPFHDASPCACTYDLNVLDCLRGLAKARAYRFFDFSRFDVEEYEYFEQVENGDLNWILYDKILAFAGPHHRRNITPEGYCTLTPADYIPYFQRKNIGLVVRLNKKCYDEQDFIKAGIDHYEQYYLDGSCPPMKTLQKILTAFEAVPDDKGFAVHCKAGLGRTGTCIGAYMMKHYRLTSAEVIGWMRICRPGMVIGPQQHFLADIEQRMWHEGSVMSEKPTRSLFGSVADKLMGSRESSEGSKGRRKSAKYDQSEQEGMIITKLAPPFESLSVDGEETQDKDEEITGQGTSLLARRVEAERRRHATTGL